MAPYCWAPSQRVRELLNALGADVGERADKETSRAIYEFVVKHIGVDRARFNGDFDLPSPTDHSREEQDCAGAMLRSGRSRSSEFHRGGRDA